MKEEKYSFEVVEAARRLREEGLKWYAVANRLGVNSDGLRRRIEPEYRLAQNRRVAMREERRAEAVGTVSRITPREALAVIARVPCDTRGLTSRLMGDPLPERSALARRQVIHASFSQPNIDA
jgi:hypothetical protein